ncbi:MAG: ATP-dependent Clp protease ATP-binding subunit [Oscillospiraceae bacterium]|nr:ATP-dependent Clp protease ATP-binding subunit [Oscillospiraceae bacterium]
MICSRCKKRPAVIFMTRMEGDKTINEGLCLVCAKELGLKPIDDLMKKFNIGDEELEAFSNQFMMPGEDDENGFEAGGSPTFPNIFGGLVNGGQADADAGQKQKKREKGKPDEQKRKFLDAYCENLSQKARDGRLDRIIGRDKEIYRTIQILSRRQKNNPCLIGEAGVGKTAIAEGIALRIASGDEPARMLDKEVYLLDLTALVAGTQFRGQFESRVKGLVNEVKAAGNIILFIDEVHNLTGAGDADGAMSAANILKPALSRGEIQVIGATTFAEYRKYIEKDQALERRFQPVKVEEPSIADTVEMLKGIKEYYEKYHGVKISDATVELIVSLSERYISDRFLPDKAIDLLDESAACCALRSPELAEYQELTKKCEMLLDAEKAEQEQETPDYEKIATIKSEGIKYNERIQQLLPAVNALEVTTEDLSKVIELWTGIPATKIQQSEYKKIEGLEAAMEKRIIGQDEAVRAVADAIKRTRVGLSKRRRPASFIFVGPTGVGKTELVKVLASELFSGVDPLIRLDMSEYMEKHTVARLLGSPPGYVGYDEAGQLTEKVRRRPYSVVLFDEIEKAHPDVMNILLQILDEGRVTDGQGRTVNFENTVICMTSNAGSSDKTGLAGFGKTLEGMSEETTLKALSDFLRPEFLSRVDEVVVFKPLSKESMQKIAALMLEEMREPLLEKFVTLSYDDAALETLTTLADGGKYGARDLRRVIRKQVEDKVANLLVERGGNQPKGVHITAVDDKIVCEAKD